MQVTTILKSFYPITQEDLSRFIVELVQDAEGKPLFSVTFLSNVVGDAENYRMFKELFAKIFGKPARIVYRSEDVKNSESGDDRVSRDVHIEERYFIGDMI